MSFFCPYEPGAKEKMKADRNTDNRPHIICIPGSFYFFLCMRRQPQSFRLPGGESETCPADYRTLALSTQKRWGSAAPPEPTLSPQKRWAKPEPSNPTPLPPQSPSPSSPKPSPPAPRSPHPKTSHASGSHSH